MIRKKASTRGRRQGERISRASSIVEGEKKRTQSEAKPKDLGPDSGEKSTKATWKKNEKRGVVPI